MKLEFEVCLKPKDLFGYMMVHTYTSFAGVIGLALSISALIGFFYTLGWENINNSYRVVLLITALLFTVIQPIMLYYKSAKQLKRNESLAKPIKYIFDSRQIELVQGDDHVIYEWHDVVKARSTAKLILVYVGPRNAFILTKEAVGDNVSKLRDMILAYSQAYSVHIK